MNSKRSKLLSLLLSALLIFLLAACGGGSSNSGGSTNSGGSGADAQTQTGSGGDSNSSGDDSGGEGLTGEFEIQYFVGGYGDAWWKYALSEFQKLHPNLTIKESAGPKINEQMKPRWIQGDPPDFVYIDGAGSNTRQMVEDDQLMDITDFLKEAVNADGQRILDILIAQPEEYVSGKYHAVPLVFGSWGTFYDRALFEEKGWNPPTDWQSFVELGEKIKSEGNMSVYVHTGVYPYYINGAMLDPTIVAMNDYDTSIIQRINKLEEGIWRSEPVMKALERYVEMRDRGFIDQGSVALNHTDSQMLWLQHRAAFIPTGLWVENEMAADVPEGFAFGFVPSIGQDAGGKFVANPYTSTVAIAKKAKNPEAAKEFLKFIFTEDMAKKWAEMSGAPANIKTDLSDTNATELTKQAVEFFSSDNTVVSPEVVIPEEVVKARNDATVALTIGEITPEEWAERVEKASAQARGNS